MWSAIDGVCFANFIKLVLVSILLSVPLAWLCMGKWLQGFAYRQDMQWWMFAVSGLGAMGIAMLTMSAQFTKAARSNPVNCLKEQ